MIRRACRSALFPFFSLLACGLISCAMASPQGDDAAATVPERARGITMNRIMADPEWIGRPPEGAYWADNGQSIFFRQKRVGEDERDTFEIDLQGNVLRTLSDAELAHIDQRGGSLNRDRTLKIYSNHGDLFLKDLRTSEVTQLTRTKGSESSPSFMADQERIMFHRNGALILRDLTTGIEEQPYDLRAEKDPGDARPKPDDQKNYLAKQQERLYPHFQEKKEKDEAAKASRKEREAADTTRLPKPWYFGSGISIRQSSLSPDGRFVLVAWRKNGDTSGQRDTMPNYVNADGYNSTRNVRSKVGTGKEYSDSLALLDLETHERYDLDLTTLPGIFDHPLDALKDNEKDDPVAPTSQPETQPENDQPQKARNVSINRISWSEDGSNVLLQAWSTDNKTRWIASVDLTQHTLVPVEHLHDDAWVSWRFSSMGWMPDNETYWFLAEELDGYGHLYLRRVGSDDRRQLTSGTYEVSSVHPSRDGSTIYFTSTREHPGIKETYRVSVGNGTIERTTFLDGHNRATLSPDETHWLIEHSKRRQPTELYVQRNEPGVDAVRLTQTVSEEYQALPWIEPLIIEIPSTHTDRIIYAKLYLPPDDVAPFFDDGTRPGVAFVHGAGYLQNVHYGWSHYFREDMFHCLLAYRGFVVIDLDYRASSGYGRDWRTAIYRQMGTPELEDYSDAIDWLVENQQVRRDRVGVYGGSYGGFLALMGLFRTPDLFACGAALRPVTDWAHYNHGYTANILNTPEIDPEAYENSSPIEFAEGLTKPLLICHGMQDDNVFYQDTVRLAQRLIELEKENWEVAAYPIEPHGFRRPSSWLDEYRRIYKLFDTHLKAE